MAHANGTYSGFATKGGTPRQHLEAQLRYQRIQMEAACRLLRDELGVDEYLTWCNEVLTDEMSASEVTRLARQYLDDLATCTCRDDGAGSVCPACKRYIRRGSGDEALEF